MSDEQPLFDDTRKALIFALTWVPPVKRPAMTAAMAEGVAKKKPKKVRRKKGDPLLIQEHEDVDGRIDTRRKQPKFTALDRAGQVGMVLAQFGKMDEVHRILLEARLIRTGEPCACRRPCCSGWAANMRWVNLVSRICELIKEANDVIRQPGKRGLSTHPGLRRALVEQYLTGAGATLVELAGLAECTTITAAKHRAWIVEHLERLETEAWEEAASLFDRVGVTGTFTD